VVDVFFCWIKTGQGGPCQFHTLNTPGQLGTTTSGLLLKQSEIIKTPRPTRRKLFRNSFSSNEPPHWQMAEKDWTNIIELNSVTSDIHRPGNSTESCGGVDWVA